MTAPKPGGVLDVRDVSVHFGARHALSHITLQLHAGERLALVGANGSGKSTLLRVLHGLVQPSAGQVNSDVAQQQAMVFQRPHMLRTSAQNHVALALWLRGVPWRQARAQALVALARVGLQAVAAQNARSLSGGQQQRVAMARAWALAPQVLLLDEPTASLDPHAKREVEALMAEFASPAPNTALPLTMVFSSHNLGQVKRLASRVVYLEQGRIVADLPVHDFFNGPLPEAARLFVKGELA